MLCSYVDIDSCFCIDHVCSIFFSGLEWLMSKKFDLLDPKVSDPCFLAQAPQVQVFSHVRCLSDVIQGPLASSSLLRLIPVLWVTDLIDWFSEINEEVTSFLLSWLKYKQNPGQDNPHLIGLLNLRPPKILIYCKLDITFLDCFLLHLLFICREISL